MIPMCLDLGIWQRKGHQYITSIQLESQTHDYHEVAGFLISVRVTSMSEPRWPLVTVGDGRSPPRKETTGDPQYAGHHKAQ